jgi:hypothetical protein
MATDPLKHQGGPAGGRLTQVYRQNDADYRDRLQRSNTITLPLGVT